MEQHMMQQFRIQEQTSAHMMAMQSPLAYKYKPTIQYSVELYRTPKEGVDGRLRIQLRTQSRELLSMLDEFFRLWVQLEKSYAEGAAEYRIAPARMERTLRNPCPEDGEQFGELIGLYIKRLDAYIKAYFAGENHVELAKSFCREKQLHI